jgi:NADPH-dependent ferric siderophore reductase
VTSTSDAIAGAAELLLAHVNGDHPDALLLIGQTLGGQPAAVEVRAVGVDGAGLDLVAVDAAGTAATVRVEFPQPADDVYALREQAIALTLLARERSGQPGQTALERQATELAAIRTFVTSVVAVRDVTPKVRRITFGGGDLSTFSPIAPDQFLYVLLPPPGRSELTIDQSFTWSAYEHLPEAERPVGAYYTVRAWRPDVAELDMDFVLHTPAGPACEWAARAGVGDPVALWGPRTSLAPPPSTDWYLLFADDTGLPALAGILGALPDGTRVRAFVEVADADEIQPLPIGPAIDITWFTRNGAEPGTTTALLDAVRDMPWPGGTPYVWGGAESRTLTQIRKYLRNEVGLGREQVSLVGYWRRNPEEPLDDDE